MKYVSSLHLLRKTVLIQLQWAVRVALNRNRNLISQLLELRHLPLQLLQQVLGSRCQQYPRCHHLAEAKSNGIYEMCQKRGLLVLKCNGRIKH